MFLQRTVGGDTFLGGLYSYPQQAVVESLTPADQSFQMVPGLRLQFGLRITDQIGWDVIYFGLQNWSESEGVRAHPYSQGTVGFSPYTQTDYLIGGFGSTFGYTYGSSLQNVEVNRSRRFQTSGPWSFGTLIGFRYFQWDETLNLNGTDRFYPAYENIDVNSNNYLVGGQVGAQLQRDWERFHLQLIGKAALMANFTSVHESNLRSSGYRYGNPAGFIPFDGSAHGVNTAGVIDFSAMASYSISPHCLLRGGYQMLFVPGLALAPGQLDGDGHLGGVFMHGPTAGLEWTW